MGVVVVVVVSLAVVVVGMVVVAVGGELRACLLVRVAVAVVVMLVRWVVRVFAREGAHAVTAAV